MRFFTEIVTKLGDSPTWMTKSSLNFSQISSQNVSRMSVTNYSLNFYISHEICHWNRHQIWWCTGFFTKFGDDFFTKFFTKHPGIPSYTPLDNVRKKVPQTTLASLYIPPLRAMPIYGNNKFQKGASLIKGIKYIRNIKYIKWNMSDVQHTHTAWSGIKFIERIYIMNIKSTIRIGSWH